jgi:hypothetical protein
MWSKAIYIIGMAVLGAGIGYFVTLSRSPVVGILLPLLFSLIGGAGGVFLARQDLTQKAGRERLGILGASIVALVGAAILTSILVFSRNTRSVNPELTEVPGYKALAPDEQYTVLEMRMMATLLGATEKEKVQLLASAAKRENETKNNLDPPELVISRLEAMQPALESVAHQLDDEFINKTDEQVKKTLIQTRAIAQSSAYLFGVWSSRKLANTSYAVVKQQLDILNNALDNIVGKGVVSSPVLTAAAGRPPLLEALFNLRATMETQPLNLISEPDQNAPEVQSILSRSERIELLKILAGMPVQERPGSYVNSLADLVRVGGGGT